MFRYFIILFVYLIIIDCHSDSIPYGNGAWVYDATYKENGKKGPTVPGVFKNQLSIYNTKYAKNNNSKINQVFVYGGDIEIDDEGNKPNNTDIYYYPQNTQSGNSWKQADLNFLIKGTSGFVSAQAYQPKDQFLYGKNNSPLLTDKTGIDGVNYKILVIDGRVDNEGYLQRLNTMKETQARGLARKVARTICADNSIDGIQFDIEPFSFTGKGGKSGNGQKYFYQELAKCFAGWYTEKYSVVSGINKYGKNYNHKYDLINAVNKKHPYGRFFSVFTFADSVTPDVINIYRKFGNFYIIDSLYDLENIPGASQPTSLSKYEGLVQKEIKKMRNKKIAYQFAIPAAASCHEFESCDGMINKNINSQLEYVKIALDKIAPQKLRSIDKYFKGIAVWSWNTQMWWNGHKLEPAKPNNKILEYLGQSL